MAASCQLNFLEGSFVDFVNPPLIGKSINYLRNARKMSLATLSERSGVSKSMLSQIEQDKTNPTVVTLWKIARALNISVQDLMGSANDSIEVVRFSDLPFIQSPDKLCEIRIDSPVHMADNLELYHFTLMRDGRHFSKPHYPSEEYLTVIDGKVRVTIGKNSVQLSKGDTCRYRGDVDHAVENIHDGPSELYVIVLFTKS
jgi:XRE family transcriptional regulator, regulator of sulfur utilization